MELILLLLAMIPGLALIYYVYRLDKVESEPKKLLARLLIGGALITVPVYFGEVLVTKGTYLFLRSGSFAADLIISFIGVALIEEAGKYLVMKLITWNDPEFNYTFDAIVYACVVSMGFAILENIVYVFGNGGIQTAIVRALLSIPGHLVFAICMGSFYGQAKLIRTQKGDTAGQRYLYRALLLSALVHGFYDFCLSRPEAVWTIIFFGFLAALYVYAFTGIRKLSAGDRAIEAEVYEEDDKTDGTPRAR